MFCLKYVCIYTMKFGDNLNLQTGFDMEFLFGYNNKAEHTKTHT